MGRRTVKPRKGRTVPPSELPERGSCNQRGSLLLAGARAGGVVLVVGDMVSPVGGGVVVVDFVDGEVNHQPGGRRAVPVLFVGLDVDPVPGGDRRGGDVGRASAQP